MEKYFLIAFIVIFAIWYLSYSATRLDRLHHRVETSWANLDGLLQRRAAVALEIAKSDIADPASSLLLTAAAHQARDAQMKARSQAESGLSGALGLLLNDGHLVSGSIEKDLLRELSELTDKIRMAIDLDTVKMPREISLTNTVRHNALGVRKTLL